VQDGLVLYPKNVLLQMKRHTQFIRTPYTRHNFVVSASPCFFMSVATRKKWNVEGAITSVNRNRYYNIPLESSSQQFLLPLIRKGDYIMFYGPPGSSKSSHLDTTKELLKDEFNCLTTSFQSEVNFESESAFWMSFGKALRRDNLFTRTEIPPIFSADDFACFLTSKTNPFEDTPKTVIFVDDFHLISHAHPRVAESFFLILRAIKQMRTSYVLQVMSYCYEIN
jgi:hypothetical protein